MLRILVYLLGIYTLRNTDFAAESWLQNTLYPIIDFFFLIYLAFGLVFFFYRTESIAADYSNDGLLAEAPGALWQEIYHHWLEKLDRHGALAETGAIVIGIVEILLMVFAVGQVFILLTEALSTGA